VEVTLIEGTVNCFLHCLALIGQSGPRVDRVAAGHAEEDDLPFQEADGGSGKGAAFLELMAARHRSIELPETHSRRVLRAAYELHVAGKGSVLFLEAAGAMRR